ncbi:MAG: hypothetical protein Ct9H300mP28_37210 [Pseudomonadota bacterium]|nr:MAG: hypothetical protein Ct9H300mP28_37210 [Pseudomonadota bacterium]
MARLSLGKKTLEISQQGKKAREISELFVERLKCLTWKAGPIYR